MDSSYVGIVFHVNEHTKFPRSFRLIVLKEQVEVKVSEVRVLIVDDFAPWHSLIKTQLELETEWRIIGSALDGLDAVQKTAELLPDLVLMDIHLPKMNGIEAARQIRAMIPQAKIIFLSSDTDPGVIEAALSAGGLGYISKAKIAECLLRGMKSVLAGQPFILFD